MLEFGRNESWLLQDDSASAAKYIARYEPGDEATHAQWRVVVAHAQCSS